MTGTGRLSGTWLVIAAVATNALTALYLMRVPMYQSSTTTATSDGRYATRTGTETLLEANGWSAIVPLLIPVFIAALPLLAPGRRPAVVARALAAFLLLAYVVLGSMTVGLFYLPSALLMTIAVFLAIRPPLRASDSA